MCWHTVIPIGKYKGRTMNDVRVCDMEYLGWAYRKIPWFKAQIDSNKRFYAMVREHALLPSWNKEHISKHWRQYGRVIKVTC